MIWLCQLLCPQRHCILAVAYDPENIPKEAVEAGLQGKFADMVSAHLVRPLCELCRSTELHYEHGQSKFATMDEALPELKKVELANLLSQQWLKQTRN